jgi:thymidylate synthase
VAEYTFNNVNDAFRRLVSDIHLGLLPTDVQPSRYGEVIRVTEPVMVTYRHPWECVLLNSSRDTPVYFLLYEALWMLAGRNDVAPLAYYNNRMTEFSDDGETFNGAYGYRWRFTFGKDRPSPYGAGTVRTYYDQLDLVVNHLRFKPESRRAVLNMWTVEDDLLKVDASKDVCCNLNVCFDVEGCKGKPHDVPRYLNMTVFNRSNDLVWGMLGANAVHFAFLLAYLAGRLGLEVGRYRQITNNLHVYTKNWKPGEWLDDSVKEYPKELRTSRTPLVKNPEVFEAELRRIVDRFDGGSSGREDYEDYKEPFFHTVVNPLLSAFRAYKRQEYDVALDLLEGVGDWAWREAGKGWVRRRLDRKGVGS